MNPQKVHNALAQVVDVYGELLVERARAVSLLQETISRQAETIARQQVEREEARREQDAALGKMNDLFERLNEEKEQAAVGKRRLLEEVASVRALLASAVEACRASENENKELRARLTRHESVG